MPIRVRQHVKFTLENMCRHFEPWLIVNANQRAEVRFKMAARMRLNGDLHMMPDAYAFQLCQSLNGLQICDNCVFKYHLSNMNSWYKCKCDRICIQQHAQMYTLSFMLTAILNRTSASWFALNNTLSYKQNNSVVSNLWIYHTVYMIVCYILCSSYVV
jgi:hypothetical protein